jgi:hypothetical protein
VLAACWAGAARASDPEPASSAAASASDAGGGSGGSPASTAASDSAQPTAHDAGAGNWATTAGSGSPAGTNAADGPAAGNGNGAANGQADGSGQANANVPENATAAPNSQANGNGAANGQANGNGPANSNGNGAEASANAHANQGNPGNSNVSVRVERPGDNGPVTQENTASSEASGSTAGDAGIPASTGDQAGGQADAESGQTTPSNLNVSVRVSSAGDNGQVTQENAANAQAAAGGPGSSGSAMLGDAASNADSTQSNPQNVNLSVRVGSPGDDASIDQTNSASAVAAGSAGTATAPGTNGDSDGRSSVDNSASIDQGVEQCADECLPAPSDGSTGAATTDQDSETTAGGVDTEASATQISPSNVNVSVRVGSPGDRHGVTQRNDASADADVAVTTTTGEDNLDLAVTLTGDNVVSVPAGLVPWIWNWVWTTGAPPFGPDSAPTSTSIWDWIWTQQPSGSSAAPAGTSSVAPVEGHWIWNWTWTRSDGWSSGFTADLPCTCAWVWTWTWTWTDDESTGETAAPVGEEPEITAEPVVQTNSSTAIAVAATNFAGDQEIVRADEASDETASALQSIGSQQLATATALAQQDDALNSSFVAAGIVESITQLNEIVATAFARADLTVSQAVHQSQTGLDDGATHTVAAEQSVESLQSSDADAHVVQDRAVNTTTILGPVANTAAIGAVSQENTAEALAVAASVATVLQTVAQVQAGEGSDQTAKALQGIVNLQAATASADSAQSNVKNIVFVEIPLYGVSNPSVTQSNAVSSIADTTNTSDFVQDALQTASGEFIAWHEEATQTATVTQSGDAGIALAQADRENRSGWNGVFSPPSAQPTAETVSTVHVDTPPTGAAAESAAAPAVPRSLFMTTLSVSGRRPPAAAKPLVEPPAKTKLGKSTVKSPRSRSAATGARGSRPKPGAGAVPLLRPVAAATGSSIAATSRAGHSKKPAAHRRSSRGQGGCPQCMKLAFGTATASAPGSGAPGVTAALSRYRQFAAPGVGRPQNPAPALGRPVDTAPFERPG